MANIITLRNTYKTKEVYIQPLKMKNGMNFPFVKKVRYMENGDTEMIMSEAERNNPESEYYISEDHLIYLTDGTRFDLDNPLERNIWTSIKDSELIVPTRDAKDEHGNLIIDGDKRRYGLAEFYVDIPGEESTRSISRKKLITRAWMYIENDTASGRLTKVKLLGKPMRNAHESDVADYLYVHAEKNPNQIIELYTSSDTGLKLLLIDAVEKGIISKLHGLYIYGETNLGAMDDSVITFLKQPTNKGILDSIKNDVYPDFVKKITNEDNTNESMDETKVKKQTNKKE